MDDPFTKDEEDIDNNGEKVKEGKGENENLLGGPTFYPPLYIQRYTFVRGILDELKPESVVDFGSAELGIFRHLKEVTTLLRVNLVDLDSSLLEVHKHRIRPCCYDYLQKRKNPLSVQILAGNATKFDNRMEDFEAVTMVEFIEHLYEEDLQKVIKMVFECIYPRIVVMTTPNYEFNELFPGPRRFRHWDHKFEWTRNQFENWCRDIGERYDYSYRFHGIGNDPEGSEHLGCCSQAVVMIRQGLKHQRKSDIQTTVYHVIDSSYYPHDELSNRDPEDILASEVSYVLSFMSQGTDYYDEEDTTASIPVEKIHGFKKISNKCSLTELSDFLVKKGYTIHKNANDEDCVCIELCSEDYRSEWFGDQDEEDDYFDNDEDTTEKVTICNINAEPEEWWD